MVVRLIIFAGLVTAAAVAFTYFVDREKEKAACPPPSHTVEFHCTVDDPAVAGNRAVKEQIEVLRNAD